MTDLGSANIQGALHVAVPLGRKKQIKKEARTLYVNRPVLNAMDIIAWAKANGFAKTVTPDDMHVTVAFSRQPVEWIYPSPNKEISFIPENPSLARFGPDGACIVLQFNCGALADRWQHFIDSGASWDWPDYCPHITITYNGDSTTDLDQIEPYAGQIVLGPEEFDELNEGWGDNVVEKAGPPDEPRDQKGRWTTGKTVDAPLTSIKAGQPSSETNQAKVKFYRDKLKRGEKLPPVSVLLDRQRGTLHLLDGHHRWIAAKAEGKSSIKAKILFSEDTSKAAQRTLTQYYRQLGFKKHNEDNDMDLVEAEQLQKRGARNNKTDKGMIQQMHDHSVSLGASCDYSGDADVGKVARIAKIDESLGLVFGYAIVCNVNGQPYYDLNIDKASDGSYKRVPEHIPEESMLKAAVDFMQTSRVGNEMHDGPDVGTYVFAFPMTAEIAKAFGIQTSTTGLMIAYKPTPEVFAKFKDGTYTGFSIEGSRVKSQEIEG